MQYASVVEKEAWAIKKNLPILKRTEDLVQEGWVGLLQASKSYIPSEQATFTSYASCRIKGSIRDSLRRNDHLTTRERRVLNAKSKMVPVEEQLRFDYLPNNPELLSLSGASSDFRADCSAVDPYTESLSNCRFEILSEALSKIPPRYKMVLDLIYNSELTLKEVGVVLGVSEGQVCRIRQFALDKLRDYFKERNITAKDIGLTK